MPVAIEQVAGAPLADLGTHRCHGTEARNTECSVPHAAPGMGRSADEAGFGTEIGSQELDR